MTAETPLHPPRVRLVVRVGVTGHRDLSEADPRVLAGTVRRALEAVGAGARAVLERPDHGYLQEPPLLRVVSPLADGADRVVAREALALGYDLQCPLPFPREVYREDFRDASSLGEFDAMLRRASAVLELDGARARAEEAYEAVGVLMLDHADVLIAIWDGEASRPRGGTAHILEHALNNRVPCLHVNARAPHDTRLYVDAVGGDFHAVAADELQATVEAMLVPPVPASADDPDLRPGYFRETLGLRWLGRRFARLWGLMARLLLPRDRREAEPAEGQETAFLAAARAPYDAHFAWADRLSQEYSALHRSGVVASLALKAFAVTCGLAVALAPTWPAWVQTWLLAQLFSVLVIVGMTYVARWLRWQQKAIDYRLIAEQLRQARILAALGRGLPFTRPPIHYAYGDPRGTWMTWHVRAVLRAAGLPSLRMDAPHLERARALLREEGIGAQIRYHETNARRVRTMGDRLERSSVVLLFVTIGAWAWFYFAGREDPSLLYRVLRMLSVVLPGWAAVLTAIASSGQFGRMARRSDAMARHLRTLLERLDRPGAELTSITLGSVSVTVARWLIEETVDWRMVFQAQPTRLPSGLVYSLPK